VIDTGDVDVFLGLDVGKGEHHGTAVTRTGKRVFDKQLPNSEPKMRAVLDKLTAKHGTVLVIVDQPASIGALPLAVARDAGCRVAYLSGLTMRRIADLYPGEAKTDARDAFVIADAARTVPHTLRGIEFTDETIAELEMIVGFDDDLAGEATRIANRLRGLLTQIHPHLERVLGPRLDHPAVQALLERFGSPAALRKAGRRRLLGVARPLAPRMFERLVGDILTSMPGIGTRTGARVLIDVGDASAFPTAAHLASYAGLAPATRSSGSSIRGEQPSRRGNKQLKRAFFLAAFASLSDPASRTYYDKKISQGKRHTQALLCLARRRVDVLFAMLRDGTFYQSRPADVVS
jgi:transposase